MFDDFKVSAEDWNQDGAWYNTLSLLEKMGIKTGRQNFKKVTQRAMQKVRNNSRGIGDSSITMGCNVLQRYLESC